MLITYLLFKHDKYSTNKNITNTVNMIKILKNYVTLKQLN